MPIHQGKKIKKAVDESKLRVMDIAAKAGIPISSLYDIFKKEDIPRKKLKKLCEVLELSLDEMYFESQEISEPFQKVINPELLRLTAENELLKKRIEDLERIINLINESKANNQGNVQHGG
jgi:DNA-binding Xre family transcriptional regulator